MKNNFYFNLYKAYTEWRETLKNDRAYKNYVKSLNKENNGQNVLQGVIEKKDIDLAWVKRIEDALPYMDNAIRESRSFIEQKDEIVNIEKVKRVNTQSIRHLAQHTNLIAKVEDNGEVLPSKILNIYYESNVAIYENRFLYTLLQRLSEFIETRYQALCNKDEKIEIKYNIQKTLKNKQKFSNLKLEVDFKNDGAVKKTSIKDDINKLSGYARILRIRSIVQDFFASALIRDLKGVQEVRSPIIRTNLMSKNTNFRTCLELWDYIERYHGLGYTYLNKTFEGKMPENIKENLSNIVIFGNFLTEIAFDAEKEKSLRKEYHLNLKQEKKLKNLELNQRKDETMKETKQIFDVKTNKLKLSFEEKMNKLKQYLLNRNEKLKLKQQKIEKAHQQEILLVKQKKEELKKLNRELKKVNLELQKEKKEEFRKFNKNLKTINLEFQKEKNLLNKQKNRLEKENILLSQKNNKK